MNIAAKVAAHASDCYKEAYTSAKTESAKKIIPDVRIRLIFVFRESHYFLTSKFPVSSDTFKILFPF